jgi:hypothetical protein
MKTMGNFDVMLSKCLADEIRDDERDENSLSQMMESVRPFQLGSFFFLFLSTRSHFIDFILTR